jgi:hypothetical protein
MWSLDSYIKLSEALVEQERLTISEFTSVICGFRNA